MSKRASTSKITPARKKRVKRNQSKVAMFLDVEAGISSGSEDDEMGSEDEFIVDRKSPLQDQRAWNIMEEFLITSMTYSDMEEKLASHLGSRYREEDWADAKKALFSGDDDNSLSLDNLRALRARHISQLSSISGIHSGIQPGRSWMNKVDDIANRYAASSSSQVPVPSPPRVPSGNAELLEYDVERPSPPPPVVPIHSQDVVPELPTWLVTVPVSKTSYLASHLRRQGVEVYTHSTLPGRLCIKAKDTLVIRESWPLSHGNCFINAVYLPSDDQASTAPEVAIPAWYRTKRGKYRNLVGYGKSYDPPSDQITLLVASKEFTVSAVGDTQISLQSLVIKRTALVHIPIPAPADIALHEESRHDPVLVQSTLHLYSAQYWIEGDAVRVTAGEMIGCIGKVHCVDMATHSASVYMDESLEVEVSPTPVMFPLAGLARKFSIGDSVRVLDGSVASLTQSGKGGVVVALDESTATIHDMSTQYEFAVRIDSLVTWSSVSTFGDASGSRDTSASLTKGDTSASLTPMKGDSVVVHEGSYVAETGVVQKVDSVAKTLTFLNWKQVEITVPMKETSFRPNPAAIRFTDEYGYDVVAGDVVEVVRGDHLHAKGTVLSVDLVNKTLTFQQTPEIECTTCITYVTRIGGRGIRDPMGKYIGQEVFIVHGHMKSYRGTLQSLSETKCVVAVLQGSRHEFKRNEVAVWAGRLLNGDPLPRDKHAEFQQMLKSSYIHDPHVTPPRTPLPSPRSPPPDGHSVTMWSTWTPRADELQQICQEHDPTTEDPWKINPSDREDNRLYPPDIVSPDGLAATLRNPRIHALFLEWRMKFRISQTSSSRWYSSYLDRFVDTATPDPFLLPGGLVKDGEIAVRYSSRTSNKGKKTDTIPLTCLTPEPPTGTNKTFILIRGDDGDIGRVHTTKSAPKKGKVIVTTEGREFPRADACEVTREKS